MPIVNSFHVGVNSQAPGVSDNAWLPWENWAEYANVAICNISHMCLDSRKRKVICIVLIKPTFLKAL